MNCIEALNEKIKQCAPCRMHAFIIEFEELPENERIAFDSYNSKNDFIIYCEKCGSYTLVPSK